MGVVILLLIEKYKLFPIKMSTNEQLIAQYINSLGIPSEWAISTRNSKTTIINTFSLDEFLPYRFIQQNHGKLFKEFKLRHLYALPNTPQIILVPSLPQSCREMLVLAQRGQFSLAKLVEKCHGDRNNQLDLALQLLQIVSMLQKKYGYFQLTAGMIRASKGPSPLVWINQNQVNNFPQFPIGPLIPLNLESRVEKNQRNNRITDDPMHLMVSTLFQILSENIPSNTVLGELSREKSVGLSFESAKNRLSEFLKQQPDWLCLGGEGMSIEKGKVQTEEKNKKVPEFLVNRGNFSNSKKDKGKYVNNPNKKSMLTFCTKPSNDQPTFNRQPPTSKNPDPKFFPGETNRYLFSKARKNQCDPKTLEDHFSIPYSCVVGEDKFRFSSPPNIPSSTQIKHCATRRQEKPLIRQSGKTASTSNYCSNDNSCKKFNRNNISIEAGESFDNSAWMKTSEKKAVGGGKSTPKAVEHNKSCFYKQNISRLEPKITKAIEELHEELNRELTRKTERHPSILGTLVNNRSSLTVASQHSFPGSQFYNDVDVLLHSRVTEQKNGEEELSRSLERELQKILFD